MLVYSSPKRQVFLHTPLDHIPALARTYFRANIGAWRFLRANIDTIAITFAGTGLIGACSIPLIVLILEATS